MLIQIQQYVCKYEAGTLVLMLTFIPPSLQLLPVVVQALQAHDTIVKTHPVGENEFS